MARAELYLTFGCILMCAVLIHVGVMSFKHLPLQGVLLLGINMFAGLLEMHHRTPLEGVQRVLFSFATIGPLLVLIPSLLELDGNNFLRLFRTMGFMGSLWCLAVLIQIPLDRNQLILTGSNRFTGMLGNPQGAAVYLGPMASVLTWLCLNEPQKKFRLLWIASTGLMVIFLVWTGSRTGMLMYMFGLTGILYARAGRAIFFLPIVGAGVVGLFQILTSFGIDLGYGLDRLTSGTDTRTEIWLVLLEDALSSPLLGMGEGRKGGVENSYLLAWVVYGPLMLGAMLLLMVASGIQCLRLMAVRSRLDPTQKRIVDFIVAFDAMYFAGAMFEWYILARADFTIPLWCVMAAMTERLIRIGKEQALGVWGSTDTAIYDEVETRVDIA
jgi:hypothetical protein